MKSYKPSRIEKQASSMFRISTANRKRQHLMGKHGKGKMNEYAKASTNF